MQLPFVPLNALCTAGDAATAAMDAALSAVGEAADAGAQVAGAASASVANAAHAADTASELTARVQEILSGPSVSSRAMKLSSSLDFRLSHPLASKFDEWFASRFGEVNAYSREFPLMTPHAVLVMVLSYLLMVAVGTFIVKSAGGGIKLKPVMRAYNLFMVILSAYMGTKAILLARKSNSSLFCVPFADGALGAEMAQLTWLFTFSKVVEFLDTVFMIFEGRLRQVSVLHVYHHVTILCYWFTISWMMPGSDAYFSLAGNSYIHVAMYGYYLLASFGYSPWWKYYITKAQITQFCLFCVQSIYVGYVMTEKRCDFPNVLSRGLLWYMLTLIALFGHFLVTNKRKKKSATSAKKMQ